MQSYSRDTAGRQGRWIDSGTSILLKSGLYSRAAHSGGVFVEVTYQRNALRTVFDEPENTSRLGLGLGFKGFF